MIENTLYYQIDVTDRISTAYVTTFSFSFESFELSVTDQIDTLAVYVLYVITNAGNNVHELPNNFKLGDP